MDDLKLERKEVAAEDAPARQHCWPLEVTATSTVAGLDSEIFVYHVGVADTPTAHMAAYEVIASLTQMQELPVDQPGTDPDGSYVPFFRSRKLLAYCRSSEELESLWLKVQEDVQDLLNNHRAAQNLKVTQTVTLV